MSDVSKVYDEWKKYVEGYPNKKDSMNILHEVWSPKVKWFRPPMWKMFRWAYSIDKTLLMNCVPVSCNIPHVDELDITFTAKSDTIHNMKPIAPDAHYAFLSLADKEKLNFKTLRDCIDVEFSHNEVIGIWARDKHDPMHDHLVYRGEAWATPGEYLDLTVDKYIGLVPENRREDGTINIRVKEYSNDIVCGLPKKRHDTRECVDGGQDEC